ncbi:MAG: radical SAM protein, partial [Nitrospirota bacterium]
IQPNTDLENRLLEEGYLTSGYNPLMLTPTSIRKLLYNPAPLNKLIGKACLAAWTRKQGPRTGSRDPRPWSGALAGSSPALDRVDGTYADQNLLRGVELNSGRDVLLTLDEVLNSRKSAGNQVH